MERVKGIEPSSQAWEARILPLNHTRLRSAARNFGVASPPFHNHKASRQHAQLLPDCAAGGNSFAMVLRRGSEAVDSFAQPAFNENLPLG